VAVICYDAVLAAQQTQTDSSTTTIVSFSAVLTTVMAALTPDRTFAPPPDTCLPGNRRRVHLLPGYGQSFELYS